MSIKIIRRYKEDLNRKSVFECRCVKGAREINLEEHSKEGFYVICRCCREKYRSHKEELIQAFLSSMLEISCKREYKNFTLIDERNQ